MDERLERALRKLRSIAERINMQRVAGRNPLYCTVQLDGRDLQWIDKAISALSANSDNGKVR